MSYDEERAEIYSSRDRQMRDGFFREADGLLKTDLGPKIEGETSRKIESLVIYLGVILGVSRDKMTGNPDSHDPVDRHNFARGMLACWAPSRENKTTKHTTWGRGLMPFAVVRALRECATTCKKFPSEGYIAALAAGESCEHWPGGFLRNSLPDKPRQLSKMAAHGEKIAATWREESRAAGWPTDKAAPDAVCILRAKEIQNMIGVDVLRRPPPEREPGEDG